MKNPVEKKRVTKRPRDWPKRVQRTVLKKEKIEFAERRLRLCARETLSKFETRKKQKNNF